ncbi:MAG: apolipoprotein N-acyltransferase [Thiotrichaceae bacterium]|nr:apolipoprotein N-acyltransferase [Thiotrichaceae bacterium]
MEKLIESGRGDVLAVTAGVLFTLSFSPFDFPVLVFIALAVFKLLLTELSLKKAVLRGFLFGLGIFGLGVSWVFVSMVVNEQANLTLPILMTLFYCGFWAIFPAISAYLFAKLRRNKHSDWLIFSCIWVFVEYIRGEWVLNGFPWLQVAYSQLDSPFAGFIPVFGSYGTGFVVVLLAALFAEAFIDKTKIIVIFVIFPFLIIGGGGLKGVDWTKVNGDLIKVTLIQGNIAQKDKWAIENRNITLKQYYDDSAKHWDSDVIVWPETAIPAYYADVKEDYLIPLEQEAIQNNTDIITSLPHKDKTGKLYNSVLVLGKMPGMYKKIHLLPFGEYLPWQPISGYVLGLMDIRLGNFSAGAVDQSLLKVAGHNIVTSICYEDAFGDLIRNSLPAATLLVNVSNDAWFGDSIAPHQHLEIARMRALESGRYLLRATNTGISAVINTKGKVTMHTPQFQIITLRSPAQAYQGSTPYVRFGNGLILSILLLCLLLGIKLELKHANPV